MVAAGRGDRELADPVVGLETVDLGRGEGSAAVPADNDGSVFVLGCGVAFAGFGFPALEVVRGCGQVVLHVF